jgi:hypothetical protein
MAILLIQSFGMSRQIISVHSAMQMVSISDFETTYSGMTCLVFIRSYALL